MPINKPKIGPAAKGAVGKPKEANPTDATKGKTRGMRNAGKLAQLLNMPNEIFFMITSHLTPLDMLNLTRSSKKMRSILSSKKISRHAWVAARKNVEPALPDCPDCISELEYAHVLFEHACEACDAPRARHALFEIPVRLCNHCLSANVMTGIQLMKRNNITEELTLFSIFCPLYPYCPAPNDITWSLAQPKRDDYFYEPDVTAFVVRANYSVDIGDIAGIRAHTTSLQDSVVPRMKFREAVVRWEQTVKEAQASRNKALRDARGAAVEAKLIELGVDIGDMPTGTSKWKSLVNQPRELSDKIWEALRPKLLLLIEEERERKRKYDRNTRIKQRLSELDDYLKALLGTPSLPSWSQIQGLPSIQAMRTMIVDEDKEVTEEDFDAATPGLFVEIEEFQQKMRHDLVELLAEAGALQTPGVATPSTKGKEKAVLITWSDDEACTLLDTATAVFTCVAHPVHSATYCRRAYSYAGLLEHWQRDHACRHWEPSAVCVAWDERRLEILGRLFTALGLPEDATMSAAEERVRSGRARCACGVDCTREAGRKRPHLMLSKIVEHIIDSEAHAQDSPPPKITFKPFPPGKESRMGGEN